MKSVQIYSRTFKTDFYAMIRYNSCSNEIDWGLLDNWHKSKERAQ